MKKLNNVLEKNKDTYEHLHWSIDLLIAIILAIISMLTLKRDFDAFLSDLAQKDKADTAIYIVSGLVSATVCFLFFVKACTYQKSIKTHNNYLREQKINKINQAVFASLYKANSSKMRETFRYTYGTVPKWNPIDYRSNVLVYDIHEQIRSIILGLKECVIDIDPERFNDKNVSVELVYCYPTNKKCKKNKNTSSKYRWRLISSGDTSGNKRSVSSYINEPTSFYELVDCLGEVFKNDKSAEIEDYQKKLVPKSKELSNDANKERVFYINDVRDWQHSKDGNQFGSAVGVAINIKNDYPEKTYVKAILTINTYGEKLFVEAPSYTLLGTKKKSVNRAHVDKFGLTEDDYKYVFRNIILSSYGKLLETELTQMYIRHSIRLGHICPRTGQSGCARQDGDKSSCKCSSCKCKVKLKRKIKNDYEKR